MALGAMAANPGLKVKIVPVGLSYFHPHKFRSRAVVEFGAPIDVPSQLVESFSQGGDGKRKAVGEMMEIVFDGLKSVTVRAPDYETLMVSCFHRKILERLRSRLRSIGKTLIDSSLSLWISNSSFKLEEDFILLLDIILPSDRWWNSTESSFWAIINAKAIRELFNSRKTFSSTTRC